MLLTSTYWRVLRNWNRFLDGRVDGSVGKSADNPLGAETGLSCVLAALDASCLMLDVLCFLLGVGSWMLDALCLYFVLVFDVTLERHLKPDN